MVKNIADLIKVLSDMYEKPSACNKIYLMAKLFNLKIMKDVATVDISIN